MPLGDREAQLYRVQYRGEWVVCRADETLTSQHLLTRQEVAYTEEMKMMKGCRNHKLIKPTQLARRSPARLPDVATYIFDYGSKTMGSNSADR